MTQYTNYSQLGTATLQGGIVDIKEKQNSVGDYLIITLIHTARGDNHKDGLHQLTVSFFCSDPKTIGLYRKGYLPLGRRITVMGDITDVAQVYTDKDGNLQMKKRPQISLDNAVVVDGGMGPIPQQEEMPRTVNQVIKSAPVDATPAFSGEPTLEEQPF